MHLQQPSTPKNTVADITQYHLTVANQFAIQPTQYTSFKHTMKQNTVRTPSLPTWWFLLHWEGRSLAQPFWTTVFHQPHYFITQILGDVPMATSKVLQKRTSRINSIPYKLLNIAVMKVKEALVICRVGLCWGK